MTETILTLALIAIASIGVISIFGNDVRALFGASSDAVAGDPQVHNRAARSNGRVERKKLVDFGYNPAGTTDNGE